MLNEGQRGLLDLSEANLSEANLSLSNLRQADLNVANLSGSPAKPIFRRYQRCCRFEPCRVQVFIDKKVAIKS